MNRFTFLVLILLACNLYGQEGINYDETQVPSFVLPDMMVCNDGTPVRDVKTWEKKRRPELLEYFFSQEYGRTRYDKIGVRYEDVSTNPDFLGGKATCKQVRFIFSNGEKEHEAIAMLVIPNHRKGKIPVFVAYNFKGNHSTTLDTTILYSPAFPLVKKPDHPDWQRGCQMNRWPWERIIDRGYAVITMCYHDIYPDGRGQKMIDNSIISLFPDYQQREILSDSWGAIGAWAWGSSRLVDYLETQRWVDKKKIAIMGHSRQGKAALWAGAQDERFKVVISNDSGCSGAALAKRVYGENVDRIMTTLEWWFCPAYKLYANNEAAMPFDQHELIALMAPRHVYVASAQEDNWADQKGEFLATAYATPAYELYGMKGLGTFEHPGIHQPIMTDVGYHIRAGKHDVTDYDWDRFMDFCDLHFKYGTRSYPRK